MTASKIQWTNRSDWNPIRGCTRVSPGCGGPGDHGGCYAEAMAGRFSDPGQWGHTYARRTPKGGRWTGKVELIPERLTLPLRWKKPLPGQNRVFPSSTSDIFHESLSDADIDQIFAVMALAPDWDFQVLTKRSARMREYLSGFSCDGARRFHIADAAGRLMRDGDRAQAWVAAGCGWPLPNVWLGVSAEDQPHWDQRVADLEATPAARRFVSIEPMLGPIVMSLGTVRHHPENERDNPALAQLIRAARLHIDPRLIDWIICGGESGPNARPMHPAWVRSLLYQCQLAGVPFFFKQWGEWIGLGVREGRPDDATGFWPTDAKSCIRLAPDGTRSDTGFPLQRVGRAKAGNLLDGRTWQEFPA